MLMDREVIGGTGYVALFLKVVIVGIILHTFSLLVPSLMSS